MMSLTQKIKIGAAMLILLLAMGCGSGGGNPVTPPGDNNPPPNNPPPNNPPAENPPEGRQLWGMWNIKFDEAQMTATAEPVSGVEKMFDGVDPKVIERSAGSVNLKVSSFNQATRILEMDVTLKNPHEIEGYDVHGVVYTDSAGHELRNPEGWARTFDIPDGKEVNPFKEFAKENEKTKLAPSEESTESFTIKVPGATETTPINFAVEGSWYDTEDNQYYAIENFRQTALYADGSRWFEIFADLHDWEGIIDTVTLEAPAITDQAQTPMEPITKNTWRAKIRNNSNAPVGLYQAKITAAVKGHEGIQLYSYNNIEVSTTHGWARTWGGVSGGEIDAPVLGDRARGVHVDPEGNSYVTGMFTSTVDFDPGPGVVERTSNGDFDIYLAKFCPGGKLIWVDTWGGPGSDFGDSSAVDEWGNVYLTGRFSGTMDFDPGPEYDYHIAQGKDIFLTKFNSRGIFQWARTWGGSGDDYGYGIAVDSAGNVYVTGNFEGEVDFNPDFAMDKHFANNSDAYLAKFNTNGGFVWARTWGGEGWDFGEDIGISSSGYVYVTGNYWGTCNFNPGSYYNYYTYSSNGYWDVFLLKFDSNGTFKSVKVWGGEGYDYGYGMTLSTKGDVYVTGDFQFSVDFNPSSTAWAILDVGATPTTYLSKFNSSGNFQWVRNLKGVDPEIGRIPYHDPGIGIDIDSKNNIYITGWYEGTAQFPPPWGQAHISNGSADAYIAKFTYSGDCVWAYNFGGVSRDEGFGLAIDPWDNIIVSGFFWETVDFEPGAGVTQFTSNGKDDAFLVKFLPDGGWWR